MELVLAVLLLLLCVTTATTIPQAPTLTQITQAQHANLVITTTSNEAVNKTSTPEKVPPVVSLGRKMWPLLDVFRGLFKRGPQPSPPTASAHCDLPQIIKERVARGAAGKEKQEA